MAFISLRSALSRVRLHPIENALSTRLRHSQVLNGCPVLRQASFDCMVDSFSTCSPIRAIRVQCRWRCAKCPQPRRSPVAHVCRLTSSSAHHASLLSMTLHADPSLCTLCCEAPEMLSFVSCLIVVCCGAGGLADSRIELPSNERWIADKILNGPLDFRRAPAPVCCIVACATHLGRPGRRAKSPLRHTGSPSAVCARPNCVCERF
jgi:hypothetical protein